jgi:hypothetical protein
VRCARALSARRFGRVLATLTALIVVVPQTATAGGGSASGSYEFESPLFGLAAKGGSLFVADAGAGVVRLRNGNGKLIAELPGVTDVAPIDHTSMYAVTGAPNRRLYRITDGVVSRVANLGAFEADVNPDGGEIDSNPFDVAALPGGRALVADAAANALLIVRADGTVDWVATLPERLASTKNLKRLVGCPKAEPDWEFACDLPDRIPAQAVATSVVVGPDCAWYVGELKGFPAPRRSSRVWRIEPGTRHAECGSSPDCSIVVRGLTSIVDLTFGHDGALHAVEIDEDTWLAVELGQSTVGTVNSCEVATGDCEVVTHLRLPTAVASTRRHTYATVRSLVPGRADVVRIA